jgi:cytochrome c oxidase cbb3-type subunit 3
VEGRGGAAIALANPVYLAVADDPSIRKVIAKGIPGTAMPAFAQSAGGMLTDAQIDEITKEIRSRWSRRGILDAASAPSYAPKSTGDAQRGQAAYKTFCESCHGPVGRGGQKATAITDDSFLALVSDQGLRTIVIAGRPELGAPDWRGNLAGRPMSEQEVTDVVAWLTSQRAKNPGQPYSVRNYSQQQESDDDKRK